jgi:hypothetical protein
VSAKTGKPIPENGELAFTFKRNNEFCDIWLLRQEFDFTQIVLQAAKRLMQELGIQRKSAGCL